MSATVPVAERAATVELFQTPIIVGYLELLASIVATALALRSPRFWICFPLGVLGVVLLFDAALRAQGASLGFEWVIIGAAGASLLVIGLLGRKRKIGPALALPGLHLLFYTVIIISARDASVLILATFVTGLAVVIAAAISPRLPWSALLALVGLCAMLWPFVHYGGIDLFNVIASGGGGPTAVGGILLMAALSALLWLAPQRAWSRIALYAIAALICVFAVGTLYGLASATSFSVVNALNEHLSVGTVLSGITVGTALALLRHRLFGDHLVPQAVAAPSARSAPSASREPAAQPHPVAPTPHAPADIFISYKREERARVEAIAEALRDLKLSVWFDARLQTGHSFDDEINREVRAAKCVLVCWSPGAVASEWVRAEAAIGRQRGVLAACFLEPCELYPPFNLVHAEDLSYGAFDGANPAWAKIVDQIGRLAGRPGLGAYVGLGADRAAQGLWLAENPNDPLADVLMARLRGG